MEASKDSPSLKAPAKGAPTAPSPFTRERRDLKERRLLRHPLTPLRSFEGVHLRGTKRGFTGTKRFCLYIHFVVVIARFIQLSQISKFLNLTVPWFLH